MGIQANGNLEAALAVRVASLPSPRLSFLFSPSPGSLEFHKSAGSGKGGGGGGDSELPW